MAKQITPTPPLKEQAAIDFITEISKKKGHPAEKAKVKEGGGYAHKGVADL